MTTQTRTLSSYLTDTNHTFEALHTAKEDAFWTAYMGLAEDADAARTRFDERETALQTFLRDPERLAEVRGLLKDARAARAEGASDAPSEDELIALEGWERTFAAHTIESPEARDRADALLAAESSLARARSGMRLGYQVPGQEFQEASTNKLAVLMNTSPDEAVRKAAWEGLRSIEHHVLANGFIEVVKQRNALGRMLGGEDYYDWKVTRVEGMRKREIFALLDGLEALTRDAVRDELNRYAQANGSDSTKPWNYRFATRGDMVMAQDPYFPFGLALECWGRSFAALNISYEGAELVLDLVDRKGKYENGFMHGPVPAWREQGQHRPARIQFTANAIPGMAGAGNRALGTLFHEGGHAAHFANIDMPAPCFSQEFAPTSVAFAETQSMFLDSLIADPDWLARYAKTVTGEPMPFELIEEGIRASQPTAAWEIRAMLVVPYAEKAIYELPDDELTAERILQVIRDVERQILFVEEGSPRPVLSVPHLLAGESSAYYHGYVMAEMAVYQTRAFFLARDGYLVDNPAIGPALRATYWRPGNSKRFLDFIEELTGTPLSPTHQASYATRSVETALAEARAAIARLESIPAFEAPIELGASIRVMHGNTEIASTTTGSFADASAAFARWIEAESAQTRA